MENYLYEQNLHWQGKYSAGTPREMLPELLKLMDIDHVLAISGVRRCGKSYLMKQTINHLIDRGVPPGNLLFVNLDLPAWFGRPAAEVLDEVWSVYEKIQEPQGKVYCFLDEIQALPGWEKWLKYQYDQNKGRRKFVVTGSNSRVLSSEFASLLSGRVIEKRLFPFSLRECLAHAGIDAGNPQTLALQHSRVQKIFELLMAEGGMPELLDLPEHETKREIVGAYFDAIIFKDIVPRFAVRQSTLLKELAVYLMGQATATLNLQKVADLFASNRNSLKEFIGYLSSALLLTVVEKFDYSARRRELSFKKIYLVDNSFYAFVPLRFSPDKGRLLENLVAVELLRRYDQVFYWKNNRECDFVVVQQNQPIAAFQVCYDLNESNCGREMAGLTSACKSLNLERGTILTLNQTETHQGNGCRIEVIPVHRWLLE